MNFQVPQFIEVEDKIFGPLSFKQFLYVAGGAGLGYIIYTFEIIPFFLRIIPVMLCVGFGLALAFYKVNDRPLINAVESGLKYAVSGKLYLWKKREVPLQKKEAIPGIAEGNKLYMPKLSESKLKDLSWSLDVNEKIK